MKGNRMKKVFFGGKALLIVIVCYSCGKFESKKDASYDSLFLGISLGMGKKQFYDYCWELNRQKKITHGPTNESVEFKLVEDALKNPVMMRFYPTFHEEKISEMPVTFAYEAWAPWNKQYSADSLLVEMLGVFKGWYGEEFKVLEHPTMGTVYYKMDGKRRINLFKRDDQFVQAVFTDLAVEKSVKEQKEKVSQN